MAISEQTILDTARSGLAGRGRVVLAVSGGVDSMTLLDAASRVLDSADVLRRDFRSRHGIGGSHGRVARTEARRGPRRWL